jgi:hypothetical protein
MVQFFFKHGRFFLYSSFSIKNEKNMAIRNTKTNLKKPSSIKAFCALRRRPRLRFLPTMLVSSYQLFSIFINCSQSFAFILFKKDKYFVCSFQLFSQSVAFILFKKDKYFVCSFQLFSQSVAFILFKKD